MEFKKILVSLVAFCALAAILAVNVSAFGAFDSIEVNNVEALNGADVAAFAGETLPVKVTFTATDNASDVRVKVWISGARDYSVSSERFDVLAGRTYSRVVVVTVPYDLDETEEDLSLEVAVESKDNGRIGPVSLDLAAQRESYLVEILDVSADTKVKAGEALALDIVLKNRGRQLAEDTFVTVSVPALGIERRSYFGDQSAVDESDPDKEDAVERRMFLNFPADTPAGIYLVEVRAFNADSEAVVTKKVAVVGASEDSIVVSGTSSRTVAVGEEASYTLTLVNSGNRVRVYDLVFDAPAGLTVEADESIIAVPAGTSRTVKVAATADKAGKYSFAVNVHSDGELVKTQSYALTAEGNRATTANATVLLTVVLAIIFVVLLVVLIVLLTRKPQKSEEFGESYY